MEKFSQNAETMSASFAKALKKFEELEVPNDVHEMEAIIRCCMAERKELIDDFGSFLAHGKTLLSCIKGENSSTPLFKLCHVLELERYLHLMFYLFPFSLFVLKIFETEFYDITDFVFI